MADQDPTKKGLYLDLFKKQRNHGNWTKGWWACCRKKETDNEEKITVSLNLYFFRNDKYLHIQYRNILSWTSVFVEFGFISSRT